MGYSHGREGSRAKQRYSPKIQKKKHGNSVIATRRAHSEAGSSNPYAYRLLRRKIAPRNDKLTDDLNLVLTPFPPYQGGDFPLSRENEGVVDRGIERISKLPYCIFRVHGIASLLRSSQ